MKIYHNPRCSKSRQTLDLIKQKTNNYEIIEYLKEPLEFDDYKLILEKMELKPINLVRIKERIWKEKYKEKKMSNDDIIKALVDNPKLMERPIVTTNKQAIIGRPPKNVLNLFS
jgi:arsenate reductase